MMSSEVKYNIICFSNQMWDWPLWTNKRHVMSRLSKAGHNVLFVDPPINMLRLFLKQILEGKWGILRLLTGKYKDNEYLTVYTPVRPLPSKELEATTFSKLFANYIKYSAKKLFDPKLKTVLWIYHVEIGGLSNYLDTLDYDVLVYDCVDNYSAFPSYDTPEKKKAVIVQEEYLTKKANVVFTTAPGLYERLKKLNPNTYYTPNVADFEKFKGVRTRKDLVPDDIKYLKRPIIGFTGALDEYKFDSKLVRKIALDHPGYTFVLMGPFALQDREGSLKAIGLDDLPNIKYLGTRTWSETPKYFGGFDAYIIPYQLNDYTVGGCFPVKFHEALGAGLPTIVTDMPSYIPFKDVCYIAKSYDEYSQMLKQAVDEDSPSKIRAREDVAKKQNWESKVSVMLSYISMALQA